MKDNDATFASLQGSNEKLCGFLDWLLDAIEVHNCNPGRIPTDISSVASTGLWQVLVFAKADVPASKIARGPSPLLSYEMLSIMLIQSQGWQLAAKTWTSCHMAKTSLMSPNDIS